MEDHARVIDWYRAMLIRETVADEPVDTPQADDELEDMPRPLLAGGGTGSERIEAQDTAGPNDPDS